VALVLRGPKGKSADFVNADGYLRPPLVLPRPQQHSTQVTQKVRPRRAELVLSDVPGKPRKRRRKLQRLEARPGPLAHTPQLKPTRSEVVRITSPPGRLRPRSPLRLARPLRARPLPRADTPVRI